MIGAMMCPSCRYRLQQVGQEAWHCPQCFRQFWSFEEWQQEWEKHNKPQEAM